MNRLPISTNTFIHGTRQVGVWGQSQANMLYYKVMWDAFERRLGTLMTLTNLAETGQYAAGGSWASQKNRDDMDTFDPAQGYGLSSAWADDTGGTTTDGFMTAFSYASMTTRAGGSSVGGAPIHHFITDLGYSDAAAINGENSSLLPQTAANRFYAAMVYIIGRLNAQAAVPLSTKHLMMIIGRTTNDQEYRYGYARVRGQQLKLINNVTGVKRGAETYHMELRDSAHLSEAPLGQEECGEFLADMWYKHCEGGAGMFEGPSVGGVTKINNTTVDVAITPEAGDTVNYQGSNKAGWVPMGFGFGPNRADFDYWQAITAANDPVVIPTACVKTGNTLRFTLPSAITSTTPELFYPHDNLVDNFDGSRLIKGNVSGKPLRSYADVFSA